MSKVRALAEEKLTSTEQTKVLFYMPEELFFYLEQKAAAEAGKEEKIKGYKVKVKYKPMDEQEKKARKETITRVVSQALRRLKGKEK